MSASSRECIIMLHREGKQLVLSRAHHASTRRLGYHVKLLRSHGGLDPTPGEGVVEAIEYVEPEAMQVLFDWLFVQMHRGTS